MQRSGYFSVPSSEGRFTSMYYIDMYREYLSRDNRNTGIKHLMAVRS